jgi:hypothetical protein
MWTCGNCLPVNRVVEDDCKQQEQHLQIKRDVQIVHIGVGGEEHQTGKHHKDETRQSKDICVWIELRLRLTVEERPGRPAIPYRVAPLPSASWGEFSAGLKKGADVQVKGEPGSRDDEKDTVTHRAFECRVDSIRKLDWAGRQESPDTGEDPES